MGALLGEPTGGAGDPEGYVKEAVEMGTSLNSKLDWDCLWFFVTDAYQNMAQLNLLCEYVAANNEAAKLLPKWVCNAICRTRTCRE